MDTSGLSQKAADELRRRTAVASMLSGSRRSTWQTGLLWLAGGMAVAWLAAFFFDSAKGDARRQMAQDKVKQLRDKAAEAVAEMKSGDEETRPAALG